MPDQYTVAQQAFIQQRAHQMLVDWCDHLTTSDNINGLISLNQTDPYVRYARDRKSPWISEKAPGQFRMLAAGWSAAASFLKR